MGFVNGAFDFFFLDKNFAPVILKLAVNNNIERRLSPPLIGGPVFASALSGKIHKIGL